jgi:flavin reductase (DIM6/NTAB) family NADH-FMN oxidoreductase RutF
LSPGGRLRTSLADKSQQTLNQPTISTERTIAMHNREYLENADQKMERIKKGAFLTVKAGDALNTMTIGWATIGYIWQRPVLMVAVRDSRHTFTLLENTDNFTVSIPAGSNYREAVMVCGSKSGRDLDKFKECRLLPKAAQQVQSPIVDIVGRHYECRIVYKSAMDSAFLAGDLEKLYPKKDYHTLYFGEIVACYETK